MGKGNGAKRAPLPAGPVTVASRGGIGSNLPEDVRSLALALVSASDVPSRIARPGRIELEACSECDQPVHPVLVPGDAWLRNHLFAAQTTEAPSLIAFFSDELLASLGPEARRLSASAAGPAPRSRRLPAAAPTRPGAALVAAAAAIDPRQTALVDGGADWLALAGWNYSGAHKHDRAYTPLRESYLVTDKAFGTRFTQSTAAAFAAVAGRQGTLLIVGRGEQS